MQGYALRKALGLLRMMKLSLLFSTVLSLALGLSPSALVHFNEGNAKYGKNDLLGALTEYQRAIQLDTTDPDVYCNLASVLADLQRMEESEENYLVALSIQEYHPSALFNYALLLQDKRRHKEAAILYERLLTIETGNADALSNLGSCLYELQKYEEAIEVFRNAIVLYDSVSSTYPDVDLLRSNLYEYIGRCFTKLGNINDAKESLTQSLLLNQDNMLASHMLASLEGSSTENAPPAYVSKLFDDYSVSFEESLSKLQYVVPKLMVDKLQRLNPKYNTILDLGSGTGLLGQEVSQVIDLANILIGLDLSVKMLEVSMDKKCYHLLVSCGIVEFLDQMIRDRSRKEGKIIGNFSGKSISNAIENVDSIKILNLFNTFAGSETHTVQYPSAIAAADVFVYVGNLSPILNKASRVLRNSDILIFTVEERNHIENPEDAGDEGWFLQPSGRFAHRESYIRTVIEKDCEDLRIISLERITPRYENGQPIKGLLVTIVKE